MCCGLAEDIGGSMGMQHELAELRDGRLGPDQDELMQPQHLQMDVFHRKSAQISKYYSERNEAGDK